MNGNAFIRMMRDDIATHNRKIVYSEVVNVMEYVVRQNPGCEIDPTKNVEDCFKEIEKFARAHQNERVGVVGHEQAISIVTKYLGLSDNTTDDTNAATQSVSRHIDLEDFM